MAGPFDPSNYSLDPTDPTLSLSDQLKLSRDQIAQVNPDLAGRLQQAYGQPSVLPTAQPTAPQEPQPLGGEGSANETVHGPARAPLNPIEMFNALTKDQIDPKLKHGLMDAMDDHLKMPETIGSPKIGEFLTGKKGGSGGILGTGITPMDVLAFTIGAAITRRMPQSEAIATTMGIAQLPSQMREASKMASMEVVKQKMEMLKESRQAAQLQETHLANLEKLTKLTQGWSTEQKRQAFFSLMNQGKINLTTAEGRTAAIAAGMKPEELNAIAKLKSEAKPVNVGAEREAQAQMMGYERYFDASPAEKAQIEKNVKAREDQRMAQNQQRIQLIERGQNISQGRLEIQQAKTLSQVVDINGKSALGDDKIIKADNPMQASAKSGYRYLPITQLQKLQATNLALTTVNRLEQLTNKLFAGVNKGENLLKTLELRGQRTLGDADAREFRSLLLETLPVNAQASGLTAGAAGRMGIIKIEKEIMPNDSDTADSIARKYKQLRTRFHQGRQIYFGNGIDPRLGEDHETLPEGVTVSGGRKK